MLQAGVVMMCDTGGRCGDDRCVMLEAGVVMIDV